MNINTYNNQLVKDYESLASSGAATRIPELLNTMKCWLALAVTTVSLILLAPQYTQAGSNSSPVENGKVSGSARNNTRDSLQANGSREIRRKPKRDPLDRVQISRIMESVERRNPGLKPVNGRARSASLIPQQPALLLIEKRAPESKGAPPQSDVYYYDYQRDKTIHCIVDPDTGDIHKQIEVENLQLPLTEDEVQRAFDIYLQSRFREELTASYLAATGQPLIDLRDVQYKAYTFHGDVTESKLNKRSRRCGKTRCAQILLYTEDNVSLDLSPVVNLSKARVVQGNTLPGPGSAISSDATSQGHAHVH